MIVNEQIVRIIEECRQYCFSYSGYPFDHVMLTCIAALDFKVRRLLCLRDAISNLFKSYDLTELKKAFREHEYVFSSTSSRKDRMQRMERIKNDIPDSVIVPLFSMRTTKPISLPILFNAFSTVRHSMKNYHGFKAFLYFSMFVYRYMSLYKALDHAFADTDIKGKTYMGFSSSSFDNVVFTEFFKKKGAATYHFTHAIDFIDCAIHPRFEFIASYNITADTILVWGRSSITDIKKNYPHLLNRKILVAGNNLMPEKEIKLRRSFTRCLVLLTGNSCYKENISLLQLVHEVAQNNPDIMFYIKPHPSASLMDIPDICRVLNLEMVDRTVPISVSLDSERYDFAISNQTNAYYDALYHNLPCFRYAENENVQYLGMDDKFKNGIDLIRKIQEFKTMPESELNRQARAVLIDVMGMGINKYYDYICGKKPEENSLS